MSFTLFPKTIFSTKSAINGDITVVDQFGSRSLKIGGLEQSGPMVRAIWRKALKSYQASAESRRECETTDKSRKAHSPGVENDQAVVQSFDHCENVLLLGLGGGTLVPLLQRLVETPRECESIKKSNKAHSPGVGKTRLVAIELDPVVVDLARRFFDLTKYEDSGFLKVFIGDAFEFVSGPNCRPQFVKKVEQVAQVEQVEKRNAKYTLSTFTTSTTCFSLIIVDLYLGEKFPPQAEADQFMKSLKALLTPGGTVIFNRLRSDKPEDFQKNLKKNFSEVSLVKTPANLFFLAQELRETSSYTPKKPGLHQKPLQSDHP